MKLALIAAIGRNRVIGKNGGLPWHISADLKRFKRLTTGHPIVMGRKTFESIGKPLANRRNVVVSSRPIKEVETHNSLDDALSALSKEDLVFIIGGGSLYAQALQRADLLFLTFVDYEGEGDVVFPPYEELLDTEFKQVVREDHDGFAFVDYVRK